MSVVCFLVLRSVVANLLNKLLFDVSFYLTCSVSANTKAVSTAAGRSRDRLELDPCTNSFEMKVKCDRYDKKTSVSRRAVFIQNSVREEPSWFLTVKGKHKHICTHICSSVRSACFQEGEWSPQCACQINPLDCVHTTKVYVPLEQHVYIQMSRHMCTNMYTCLCVL